SVGNATSSPCSRLSAASRIADQSSAVNAVSVMLFSSGNQWIESGGNAKDVAGFTQTGLRFCQRGSDKRNMPHLAATTRSVLAIQMQIGTRQCQHFVPVWFTRLVTIASKPDVAKDIQHCCRRMLAHLAQRQARHCT